jgi:hypothetical protein
MKQCTNFHKVGKPAVGNFVLSDSKWVHKNPPRGTFAILWEEFCVRPKRELAARDVGHRWLQLAVARYIVCSLVL